MKYNDNGEYKDIYIKTFDTLPVGAIVEYNGATIPSGWTDLGNGKIEKTSQYIEGGASISNVYGTSQENGYSQEYINGLNTYSTDEVRVGTWIDGKPIYRKVVQYTSVEAPTQPSATITNLNNVINLYGSFTDSSLFNKMPINFYVDSTFFIKTWVYQNGIYTDAKGYVGYNGNVIVEYTKTTD